MSKFQIPAMMILPFRPLWMSARGGNLRVGDRAPDFSLPALDGSAVVQLSTEFRERPVVLVFGSYTWPPFRREVPALNQLYDTHRDRVAFHVVYIQEAHPTDLWQLASNVRDGVVLASPRTDGERNEVASACVRKLGIRIPALLDGVANQTERAYTAWPDRLYLIGRDVSVRHFHLKQASGWFAAGREVETALRLLSDAAFKLFLWLCLHAERSCGSISASTVAIAHELGKSETQITTALDELLHQGVCHHLPGETIRIADRFWPYQRLPDPAAGLDSAAYIERIKQALLARTCVRSVFSPADEKLATALHRRRVPFEHIERAILLGCMRKYLTLLNHNGGTPITTLHYFTGLLDEVERLEISPAYWQYVAIQVNRLEQRWRSAACGTAPAQETK